MCIAHFENNWVYLLEPSVRGVWVNTKTGDPNSLVQVSAKTETRVVVVCFTPTTLWAILELNLLYCFQKGRFTQCFSHLGIIVALRVYILMVKGKK